MSWQDFKRTNNNRKYSNNWAIRLWFFSNFGYPHTREADAILKQFPLTVRFSILFNIWGFLLGPFYWLYKGLFKGALVIILLNLAVAKAGQYYGVPNQFDVTDLLAIPVDLISGTLVNYNYFRKEILHDDGFNIMRGIRLFH